MSVKTQGTHLFFVDSTQPEPSVVKMGCPTGIQGATNGARDQIDDTCLDATEDRSFTSGLGNPGASTVPFILKPQDGSHLSLFELKKSGVKLPWLVALSDGIAAPTLSTDGSLDISAIDRTTIEFTAYVADVDIDIATNEVVRGTLTLQRSGSFNFVPKQV